MSSLGGGGEEERRRFESSCIFLKRLGLSHWAYILELSRH